MRALSLGTWEVTSAVLEASSAMPQARVVVVDDLTAQKALEATVAHQERLASIGRLAAGVAHEIGNPLTALLMVAKLLATEREPVDLQQRLKRIVEQGGRIDAIVQSLMIFARAPSATRQPVAVSLERVVRDAVELASLAKQAPIHIELSGVAPLVEGVANELVQVLVNLLTNAIDASPAQSAVTVQLRSAGGEAEVSVQDRGSGMANEVKERIFEPFFTTKSPGRGTGLGLSIVYTLVQAHRGTIEVHSAVGTGTRVSLRFPLVAAQVVRPVA